MIGGGSSVLACPVCFGAEETSMIDGTRLGVLVLLAITLAVQGGFVGFFLYLRKRAKRIADIELDTEWSELQEGVENIMTEWLGLPPLASAHGGQIDGMIGWIHVFMLILFVGWGGFFAYCLVRFRRSRNPVANYTGVKSHTSTYLEIGVAVVEAVLLFGFAIPLWAARVDDMPPENEALIVQVTGEQFAWNVHYAGPDGVFGRTDIKLLDLQSNPLGLDRADPAAKDDVTTVNQLYLPVNRPIIVRLRSKDVIHSFGVPEFRVKQDAMPGLTIPIWFIPNVTTAEMRTRTGNPEFQYQIACAQLCGLGHYRMRGFVTVQTAEEFQKWMEERSRSRAHRIPSGRPPRAELRRASSAAERLRPCYRVTATHQSVRAPRASSAPGRVCRKTALARDIPTGTSGPISRVTARLPPGEPRVSVRLPLADVPDRSTEQNSPIQSASAIQIGSRDLHCSAPPGAIDARCKLRS